MPVAIVTGASKGFGRAIAQALTERGWSLVIDARTRDELAEEETNLNSISASAARVVAVSGDVSDGTHRTQLVDAAESLGGLDLLVNNASTLGPSPRPPLAEYDIDDLRLVYEVNTFAPLALLKLALPLLRESTNPRVIDVTSDASVEAYEGWGGYGSAKAALDHIGAVFAAEETSLRLWTVDPGDMRTDMHQAAFPGEDISDRPLPESVVPQLIELIESDLPSGRYRLADLVAAATTADIGEAKETAP
jgi:NAD(P)-dependent dehydrogenase (short-subunit alcohol dehydrogenase family)